MKAFLFVKLALLPFALFWTAAATGQPAIGLAIGVAGSLAIGAWRLYAGDLKQLEIGSVAIFGVLGLGYVSRPEFVTSHAVALSFAGLSLFAFVTVAARRPWTAEFSRTDYKESQESPIFLAINMALSVLWATLFSLLAIVHYLKAGSLVPISIVVLGALASIFGPRLLIRFALARMMAARETYRWPAPSFGARQAEDFDVAVVGAGIGGLTAAALLADAGLKVFVAEQHFQPGGFCQNFKRKLERNGERLVYRFDAGPHDFSGLWSGGPVSSILERLGVADRTEWRRIDHSYHFPDLVFDVPRDWRGYARLLAQKFPADSAGFEPLFSTLFAIHAGMFAPWLAQGGIPALGISIETLRRFPREHPLAIQWMQKPFDELVAKYVRDPGARSVLSTLKGYLADGSQQLTCGQMAPIFAYYFYGGFYPAGGSGRLADALVAAIRDRGGEVRMQCPVARISIEDGRAAGIVLADGKRIAARAVVSNADLKRTFLELIEPSQLPVDFRAQIDASQPTCSAFSVHLGVDFVLDVRPAAHLRGEQNLSITTLSLLDPAAAPPGHSVINITTLVPQTEAARWFNTDARKESGSGDQPTAYQSCKTDFGDKLIAAAESVIPGLSKHIVYRDDASPRTFSHYDWSTSGSIYGILRPSKWRGNKSPFPGLVIAGSGAQGAGIEAVVISGACAADALCPGLMARPSSTRLRQSAA